MAEVSYWRIWVVCHCWWKMLWWFWWTYDTCQSTGEIWGHPASNADGHLNHWCSMQN